MFQGVVPDEAARCVGQGVDLVRAHAVRVAPGPAGEGSLEVIGPEGCRRPLVAVGAQNAAAVGVVEKSELADELVLVGGDLLAEDAQGGIAVPRGDVAQDLVVGPVLLDDVDDVLENARLSDPLGDGPGRLAGARLGQGLGYPPAAVILLDDPGQLPEVLLPRFGEDRNRAAVLVSIEPGGPGRLVGRLLDGVALDVGDVEDPLAGRPGPTLPGTIRRE